jgi:hypothetical protein
MMERSGFFSPRRELVFATLVAAARVYRDKYPRHLPGNTQ